MAKCCECEMEFDGDTPFIRIKGEKLCVYCIDDMTPRELLEKLDIEFDCIGYPEPERI